MESEILNQFLNSSFEDERNKKIEELKKNEDVRKFLTENNIPERLLEQNPYLFSRWLKGHEPCKKCTGLSACSQKRKGYRDGIRYDGILTEYVEMCAYERARQKEYAHGENYVFRDFPEELLSVSYKEISLENENKEYIDTVIKCAEGCAKGQGMYLYGPMGSGKTYLSICAANSYARSGKSVAFIHYPTYCMNLISKVTSNEYKAESDKLAAVQLLVIDDIGAENVTDFNRALLLSVLERRMNHHRMTWFTSNEDFDSLRSHFVRSNKGENRLEAMRVLERIQSMSNVLFVNGFDRRKLSQTK